MDSDIYYSPIWIATLAVTVIGLRCLIINLAYIMISPLRRYTRKPLNHQESEGFILEYQSMAAPKSQLHPKKLYLYSSHWPMTVIQINTESALNHFLWFHNLNLYIYSILYQHYIITTFYVQQLNRPLRAFLLKMIWTISFQIFWTEITLFFDII